MAYYTEDLDFLMKYFPTYPRLYVRMLYEEYSEAEWCAGWYSLSERAEIAEEFKRWVAERELRELGVEEGVDV